MTPTFSPRRDRIRAIPPSDEPLRSAGIIRDERLARWFDPRVAYINQLRQKQREQHLRSARVGRAIFVVLTWVAAVYVMLVSAMVLG